MFRILYQYLVIVCRGYLCDGEGHSYPPLSVGVSPNSVHSPTDMSRELRTVTTAARARPHLDFTMSILPAGSKGATLRAGHCNYTHNRYINYCKYLTRGQTFSFLKRLIHH
uniref:Uncharacterized protein n=1 Tax=Seriola lalandi dorsalis TaxID=1841481 RepID=A0A3B4XHW0_SERLL